MPRIETLFVTKLYREDLNGAPTRRLVADLGHARWVIAEDDGAGQSWVRANRCPGYTSYTSPNAADCERITTSFNYGL